MICKLETSSRQKANSCGESSADGLGSVGDTIYTVCRFQGIGFINDNDLQLGGETDNILVNVAYRSLVDAYFLRTRGLGYLNGSMAVFYPDLSYFCGDVL